MFFLIFCFVYLNISFNGTNLTIAMITEREEEKMIGIEIQIEGEK